MRNKSNRKGQAAVEYILLVALLALVAVGVNRMFARALRGYYNSVSHYRTGVIGQMP